MFSFIIVSFNTAELTANCLRSLLLNTSRNDREIIVVDNASSDNSRTLLAAEFGENIKLIINPANLGFATANNIGARSARGDILFFLNSDTIINSDIIGPLKNVLDNNQKLGIISPVLLLSDGQPQPFAYGYFPDLISVFLQKMYLSDKFKISGKIRLVDWVSGAALIIRKDIFEDIGAWDEKFFLYFEDIDLCRRVKKAGLDVAVIDEIFVTHLGGQSLKTGYERKKQYYLAQDYFFRKNYGSVSALVLKILRWPYKIIKMIRS